MDNNRSSIFRRAFQKPQIIGMAILIVIFSGLLIDVSNAVGENENFYLDIQRMDRVAQFIHQNYVEDMNFDTLVDFGITGMLRILDPHTTYFNVDQYNELMMHTEGKFGGLGIQISIRDKVLTIMQPIAGTPAARAQLQSGDQIIAIDGKPTTDITIEKAVKKLRGEPGTKVSIVIRRKGELKDLEYSLTREIIEIKAVPFYGVLDSSIGYLTLSTFSKEAGSEVEKALRELLKKNIKGLVFDLRFDPGGLLPEAKEVAEKFLPRGSLIVSTRGRTQDQNNDYKSTNDPVLPPDIPVAVLVNSFSASASEIVTGAIQDWDRGVIVGDTSFGKGSVQSVLQLDQTHHLKLTTAFYYTPSGRCINRPENGVRGTSSASDADEEDSMPAANPTTGKAKRDTSRYLTKGGRTVYGGGGIVPDTVVHQKMLNMVIRSLLIKDVFFSFANIEYARLKAENRLSQGDLKVDGGVMKDFYHYLDSIKFTYKTIAQSNFDEFKHRSGLVKDSTDTSSKRIVIPGEKPQWTRGEMADLKKAAADIDSLLAHESKRALTENEKDIMRFVAEALLTRHYGPDSDAYYRYKLSDDPQLATAINFLTDKNAYSALLKPKLRTGGALR